jgi:transcriptional regulator with PAS, ATPase and Fis domain
LVAVFAAFLLAIFAVFYFTAYTTLESSSSIKASHIRELLGKTVIHSKSLLISNDTELPTLKNYIELCEKKLIEKTLKTTNGDKKTAADMLNMHISGLYKKINKYDLDNL